MAFILYRLNYCYLALLLAVALMTAAPSLAEQPVSNDNALVTIRFNQARVYYDQQLFGAISKAVAVKPSVTFDVLAYAPQTGNATVDAQWQQQASQHAQMVVASMQKMGVPLSRMQVSGQRLSGLKFDEVHVIAR